MATGTETARIDAHLREHGFPSPFIPIVPTPKQAEFFLDDHENVLYGGAAGGGKSAALLASALQYVHHARYAALLLRRTYPELTQPGALIDRAHEWLQGTAARWSGDEYKWTFPSGAVLQFGYLETEAHKFRYQSAEYQFVGFDELTGFTETQYRYLQSRLRRLAGSPIPIRARSASNPGNLGHDWVKRFFVDAETRDAGASFIPARLEDNPHLDREQYVRTLGHLDPITLAQLLNGDWTARNAGTMFRRERFVLVPEPPAIVQSVRGWDLAGTAVDLQGPASRTKRAWTVGVKLGLDAARNLYVLHAARCRLAPTERDAMIEATVAGDDRATKQMIEQEPGSGGIAQFDALRLRLRGRWVEPAKPSADKITRAGPFSSAVGSGTVRMLAGPWNGWLMDALEAFPDAGRDETDAAAHAFNDLFIATPHEGMAAPPEQAVEQDRFARETSRPFDGMRPSGRPTFG